MVCQTFSAQFSQLYGLKDMFDRHPDKAWYYIAGCDTYIHADYVANRMPKTVKTLALADAMFSVESKTFGGAAGYPARMQWGYTAWNASSSINQKCLKALGGEGGKDGWRVRHPQPRRPFARKLICLPDDDDMMHTWQALNLASPFGPIRRANVCHNAAVLS